MKDKDVKTFDLIDELVQSYPKLLESVTKVNRNLIEFIQFLNEAGLFQIIADDETSQAEIDNFVQKHQQAVSEISLIVGKVLNTERPN